VRPVRDVEEPPVAPRPAVPATGKPRSYGPDAGLAPQPQT